MNERIDRVAVMLKGEVYSYPRPARHHNVIAIMVNAYGVKPPVKGVFGFLTDAGRFVTRKEAGRIAIGARQVERLAAPPHLHSEDLW
ncbi:hypothetical protein P5704_026810 (plasmid) [Pseudomonas sp. FeN3W]|nr:hypothetical protein P5704_026810 [Pseudomonas sp. FeN3W]